MSQRKANNWIRRPDGTIELELTQGQKALIDEVDLGRVLPYKWFAHRNKLGYCVMSHTDGIKRRSRTAYLHRFILDAPNSMCVDHINGNPLDNRRCNIRLATKQQNAMNQRRHSNNRSSRFKGVWWEARRNKWRAYIRAEGKIKHIGLFDREQDAARAYNLAALHYYGEFANLNQLCPVCPFQMAGRESAKQERVLSYPVETEEQIQL
jgi:hypothetical protein